MGKRAPKTRIQVRGKGHSYYLDGAKVPGVTTILGNGIPKPALVGWAGGVVADFVANNLELADVAGRQVVTADRLVAEALKWNATRGYRAAKVADSDPLPRLALAEILKSIRYRDSGQASAKGTEVHGLAERLAYGEEITVPEGLEGHVEAYLRFLDEWNPTDALLERVGVNRRWGYMGKMDLIAEFPGLGVGLLDIKTSRSGIFAETALQVSAYGHSETMIADGGETEEAFPEVDWFGAVHVRADGYDVYRFEEVTQAPEDPAFRTFLYAKMVGEFMDRDGPAGSIISDSLPAPDGDRRPRASR